MGLRRDAGIATADARLVFSEGTPVVSHSAIRPGLDGTDPVRIRGHDAPGRVERRDRPYLQRDGRRVARSRRRQEAGRRVSCGRIAFFDPHHQQRPTIISTTTDSCTSQSESDGGWRPAFGHQPLFRIEPGNEDVDLRRRR